MHARSWPRSHFPPRFSARAVVTLRRLCHAIATWLVWLDGDTHYRAYCAHLRAHHIDAEPMSRAAFYAAEVERRWNGVRRCC
jgi:uncharacterized short protein YbdD (DUF466 family)